MEAILTKISGQIVLAVEVKAEHLIALSPYILGALAVFLFGWVLAELVSRLIIALWDKLRLEYVSEKIGLKRFLEVRKVKTKPSHLIAKALKAYLIFLFFIEATKIASLNQVAEFLSTIYSYIPQVIVAIFIMLIGSEVGRTIKLLVTTSLGFLRPNTAEILGLAAKYTIITFAVLTAISQLEIAEILVQTLFIGFVTMLTLAGGLAIGLGGKDIVREMLEDIKMNAKPSANLENNPVMGGKEPPTQDVQGNFIKK